MSHGLQQDFFKRVKDHLPKFFTDVKVLDIGSLDINGNIRHLFEQPFYYSSEHGDDLEIHSTVY